MNNIIRIVEILKAKKALELLEYFLENPEAEFYQTRIIKNVKMSRTSAIKWLNALSAYDFLRVMTEGRQKYYKLNYANPVIKQLKVLLAAAKLYPLAKNLKDVEVYLYGSAARGEDTAKSDIDILIIGKMERALLVEFAEKAKKVMNKNVNPVVMTPLEYSNLIRKDRIFYENVEKNKIRLL